MKAAVRRVAYRLARMPLIGHAVHVVAALYHLPRLRAEIANGLPRIAGLDAAWNHRFATVTDSTVKLNNRMQAVEQSSIGLLTGITTQLGLLRKDVDDLANALAEARSESTARLAEMDRRTTESDGRHAEAIRTDAETGRKVAANLDELVAQFEIFKKAIDDVGSSLPETRAVVPVGGPAIELTSVSPSRLKALTTSLRNVVRSMPIALRELRREQVEIRRTISAIGPQDVGSGSTVVAAVANGLQPSSALDLLYADSQNLAREDALQQRHDLDAAANRLDALGNTQEAVTRQLGTFTNTLDFLVRRIEFVRREVLFELRYGARPEGAASTSKIESKIIAEEKVASALAQGLLKLNLGCGHVPLDGYVNVDQRALPGVDVVADLEDLPFAAGEVAEIMSSHVLEHFPQEQLTRSLLPYWRGLLQDGGTFRAVVPDAQAMLEHHATGDYPYDDLREVLYGAQDYSGDFHYNMFKPDSLAKMLKDAGFAEVRLEAQGRKNGQCYEFDIRAIKPR